METSKDLAHSSCFLYKTVEDVAESCVAFYHDSLERKDTTENVERRNQLAKWIRDFHQKSQTLTPKVEEAIGNLEKDSCLVLMTAHQPNLFAYGGVLRKATFNQVLAEILFKRLGIPVVSFFGVADQDLVDDRWVKTAQLPDVEKRNGLLELRFDAPEKLMINSIGKPSERVLLSWQNEIKNWISRQSASIERDPGFSNLQLDSKRSESFKNFEAFWKLIQRANDFACSYADFNAFVISGIVNEVWGYATLFSRFSDCQKIFESEFCGLLARFEDYSIYVKEAMGSEGKLNGGVFGKESETIPFWYHCNCGSKTRLAVAYMDNSIGGRGSCLRCGKEYVFDFQSKTDPQISGIVSQISARSLSMPLIFFHGLGTSCYVGGVGGQEYLMQAKYVAKRLGLSFPPVLVWRPKDFYAGIGQLSALVHFKRISGTSDFAKYEKIKSGFKKILGEIDREIQEIEKQKVNIMSNLEIEKEERIQSLKDLAGKQSELRRITNYSVLMRNFKLLENVVGVMSLHPCIVDYAVNVGLEQTSEQWIAFLKENGNLSSNIRLKTLYDVFFQSIAGMLE